MDSQIVPLLQEIRSALWMLVALVALFWIIKLLKAVEGSLRRLKRRFSDRFKLIANSMFERGQYSELLEYCNNRIQERPNDGTAHWFRGKAFYQQKEYDLALESFNRVIEILPSWEKDWAGPYIERINNHKKSVNSASELA